MLFRSGWPLEESYIDYVRGAPNTGLINNPNDYPTITPALLKRLNEKAGETAITCGYHAIEFLLWGQDHSADGPGARPVSDYVTKANAQRRKEYLVACSELLIQQLEALVHAWAPENPGNYRDRFINENAYRSLWYAVYGLRVFCGKELAGERLLVA